MQILSAVSLENLASLRDILTASRREAADSPDPGETCLTEVV